MFAIKFVFKHLLFELNYCFLYSFILSIFFILSKIISYNLSNKGKCLTKRDLILAVILGFLYFLAVNINIMYIKELICIILALSPIAVGSSLGGFLGLKAKMGVDSAGKVEPNSLYDLHRFFMQEDKGKNSPGRFN